MRSIILVLVAALIAAGMPGCGLLRRKQGKSASEKLLGFEDGRGRIRETSLDDMEKQQARARGGLQLIVRASKEEYKPDEAIVLDCMIRNVTGGRSGKKERDIPVYFEVFAKMANGQRAPWLLKPVLVSEKTGSVVYRVPDFKVSRGERGHRFVTLPPQAYVGYTFTFPGNWLRPGRRFSFTCSYEVPEDFPYVIRDPRFSDEQIDILGTDRAYVRVWTGRLHSGRATFRIRRKRRFLGLF